MARETIMPAIPSPKLDVVKSAQAMKEIHEVREGLRGDPLDRFVSVRDMLTDDDILQRLDARYYTETEITATFTDYLKHDGTRALTGHWDAGAFAISAKSIKLDDTDASNHLELKWNEDAAADYVLNLLVGAGDRSFTLNGNLTVESASLVNQDLTTDASPTFAGCSLGTGELTAGSINRAAGSLTLEIGGTTVVTIAAALVTLAQTGALSDCVNAGVDTDKFLVLDAGDNIDYRTGAQVRSDIGAAGAGVVNFANVNAALATANADIDINDQDLENINQLAIGFTGPIYDMEVREAAGYVVGALRVYSDTLTHRPYLYLTKSHTDTPWNTVETLDNERLGDITFCGVSNVPAMALGANIYAIQDGAAGALVPTELVFELSSNAATRTVFTMDYTELTLASGVNFNSPNQDETHYLGRMALGWLGSGNEAGLQHRSLAIDGTNYAIQQLNLGDTYLNCSTGKQIFFRRNDATITTLDELDDLTDGGETALHAHGFTAVNAALAAADATIDLNSQNLTSVGTIGCGAITTTGNFGLNQSKFLMSNTGVTHGITDFQPTNVFFAYEISSAAVGGTTMYSLTDGDSAVGAFRITAIFGADPTDTYPAIIFRGAKKSGTSIQDLAAAETVFQLRNNATNLWTILGSGNVGIGVAPDSGKKLYAYAPDAQSAINIGIEGRTYSDAAGNYGVRGMAYGNLGTNNYGVYAYAANGGGNNYPFYDSQGNYSDGTGWHDVSDPKRKKGIRDITERDRELFYKVLDNLRLKGYKLKAEDKEKNWKAPERFGLLANDPGLPDFLSTKGKDGIAAGHVATYLIGVVQYQKDLIANLEERLARVEV